MIANERQYRITKTELARFEANLVAHDARDPSPNVEERIHQAMHDAIEALALREAMQPAGVGQA